MENSSSRGIVLVVVVRIDFSYQSSRDEIMSLTQSSHFRVKKKV